MVNSLFFDETIGETPECALHPLIHTRLEFDLAQYVEAHAISFSVWGIGQPCSSDPILATN